MFFEGEVEGDSYRRLKVKLKGDLDLANEVVLKVEHAAGAGVPTAEDLRDAANLMEALPSVWVRAEGAGDAEALHDLIGSIAPGKITFVEGVVRTVGEDPKIVLKSPKTQDADPSNESAS